MIGRRRHEDARPDDYAPGDFGKRRLSYKGHVFYSWWFCTPNGILGRLSMPEDVAAGTVSVHHEVEDHADGTISVLPRPGNSNSIMAKGLEGVSWHGYIRAGVWESID